MNKTILGSHRKLLAESQISSRRKFITSSQQKNKLLPIFFIVAWELIIIGIYLPNKFKRFFASLRYAQNNVAMELKEGGDKVDRLLLIYIIILLICGNPWAEKKSAFIRCICVICVPFLFGTEKPSCDLRHFSRHSALATFTFHFSLIYSIPQVLILQKIIFLHLKL